MSKSKIMGEILGIIKEHKTFMISSHINPDGDSIGSQLAFYSLLSDLGKKVFIVNSDPVPFSYNFLLSTEVSYVESTRNTDPGSESYERCRWENVEVGVILDCGNLRRIGEKLASRTNPRKALINIDHHSSNDYFGSCNLVDTNACATSELVFNLIEYGGIEIGQYRAKCLYTGILTDTGCFKYDNTTSEAHRIAAKLIDEGVRPDRIAELVYEVIPYGRAKLFGIALETLQLSPDGKIAQMLVTRDMFQRTGTGSADTEGFVDYVRSLKDIDVAVLFRETENSDIKVSLRSKSGLDVNKIAAMFGGGGHQSAAGCVIPGPFNKAIEAILTAIKAAKG